MKKTLTLGFLISLGLSSFGQQLELVVPTGHTGHIYQIKTNKDTTLVVSVDSRPEIIVWNYSTKKQLFNLSGHTEVVNSLSFSESGRQLLSASDDGRVINWSLDNKEKLAVKEFGKPIVGADYLSNGRYLAVSNSGMIYTWGNGNQIDSLQLSSGDIESYFLTNDLLYVGTKKGELLSATIESLAEKAKQKISEKNIATLTYDPAKKELYVGTTLGEVIQADQVTLTVKQSIKAMDLRVYKLLFDETHLWVAGRDGTVNLKKIDRKSFSIKPIEFSLGTAPAEILGLGIRGINWSVYGKKLLVANFQNQIDEWELASPKAPVKTYFGTAAPIYSIAISSSGKDLGLSSGHASSRAIDLTGVRAPMLYGNVPNGFTAVAFHPVTRQFAAVGTDRSIGVWDEKGVLIKKFTAEGRYVTTPITFDPTGRYIIRKSSEKIFEIYSLDSDQNKTLKVADGLDYRFSKDGSKIVFRTRDGLSFYDGASLKQTNKIPLKDIKDIDMQGDTLTLLMRDSKTIHQYSLAGSKIRTVRCSEVEIDQIDVVPNRGLALGTINSIRKNARTRDFSIKVINLTTGKLENILPGHTDFINDIEFVKDGAYALTASTDGKVNIYENYLGKEPLGTLIPLEKGEMVVVTPDGQFDATAGAFERLHYSKGNELLSLDQFKDLYYEPNLLSRLLGMTNEPLPTRIPIGDLSALPEMTLKHPTYNDGILGVKLNDQGGGVGRVIVMINGKEVSVSQPNPVGGETEISYEVAGHPFLKPNELNTISVKAYNADETVSTPQKKLFMLDKSSGSDVEKRPKLYAIIAGTSDYAGDKFDLRYAAKDANDFAKALQLSTKNQFGEENTSIVLLTTNDEDSTKWPMKKNIQKAFDAVAAKATARDYVIIYFSGHGTNYGTESSDFYYLTMATPDGNLANPDVRNKVGISTREITGWINQIAALKQVLIIDACHSGKLASQLMPDGLTNMPSSQTKSLEELKDRTGLYLIAGSEADAVSYEAAIFEQGLLTYSILFGMKGAALKHDKEVDIMDLLQFVSTKVPELAAEIGGVQKPEVRLPANAQSFSIGTLNDEDKAKIKLAGVKPIFIQSGIQETNSYHDQLKVGSKIDDILMHMGREENPRITYLDKKKFDGAYQIQARYSAVKGVLTATVRLYKGSLLVRTFEVEALNASSLSTKIIDEALSTLK